MAAAQLFSPLTVKNHTFKNRIGVAPMTRMSCEKDSVPRRHVLDFLVRRAENGAAIVYTKSMLLDPNWVGDLRNNRELPLQRSEDANVAYTREPLP
jgi:hypothetical protein